MKMSSFYYIMFIPVVVGIVIGLGLPLYFAIGEVALVIAILITGVVIYYMYKKLIVPALRSEWVEKNGIDSRATILSVTQTGTSMKSGADVRYLLRFGLDVENPKGANYQVQAKRLINQFHVPFYMVQGTIVKVKIDPDNPSHVVITGLEGSDLSTGFIPGVTTVTSQPVQSTPQADMAILDKLKKDQDELLASGLEQTAKILKFWKVDGIQAADDSQNVGQLYEVMVEVFPVGGQAYVTEVKILVSPKAIQDGHLAVGKLIIVKADRNNPHRMVFYKQVD